MRPTRILLWVLLATMLGTGAVFAQTTGQVFGYVQDDSGDGIAGATVVATSASLIGERGTTTDSSGKFILPLLPTGDYTLKISMDGYQSIQLTNVAVMLGKSTTANAVLKTGELLETVVVTSEFPMIESKSADTTVNFNAKQLDRIPTQARSFRDLTKFVPSITSVDVNTSTGQGAGFPSIRGEGQYGDNYLIDGLTVRDPAVKTTGTPLPFDSIDEVQIITDGFSPEFGQALGGTVNVITRSGSNEFGGSVAYLYKGDDTTAEFRDTLFANPSAYEDTDPYINFGGPVMKDKLWFFASYNRNESLDTFQATDILDSTGQLALVLPAGVTDYENDTYFGKLTWAINPKNTLSGNYTLREAATSGLGASTSTVEARSGNDIEDTRWRVNYQAIFSANSVLEVKAGNVDRQSLTTPDNNLTDAQYRITTLSVNTNNAWRLNETNRERDDYAAIFTQFWNPGGVAGSHEFKIGVEYHEPGQLSGSRFTGSGEDVISIGMNDEQPDFGLADTFDQGSMYQFRLADNGAQVPTNLTEYRVPGVLLGNRNEETGFFIQDRWETGNWNFLAGFRADKQDSFNDAEEMFFKYDFEKSFSPRASITWDATGDGKNIFKTGWGRFYDTSSTRFGEFANSRENFSFRTYAWAGAPLDADWAGIDFENEKNSGNAFDVYEMANWSFDHEQSSSSNPLSYEDVVKPAHMDRFLLEYDRQVGNDYALKARYVNGKSRGLIDDIHFFYNDWRVVNTDLKRRDYDSYELEFNGNPSPNLSFNASYVHSQSKGTSPGQFESAGFTGTSGSGNNIGVFLDRPPSNPEGWCDIYPGDCVPGSWVGDVAGRDYDSDGDVDQFDRDLYIQTFFAGLGGEDGSDDWYGFLPYSIDDQVKLHGRYTIEKWNDVYVTGFFSWASGYHYNRRGFQHLYGDYLTFSSNPWFDGEVVPVEGQDFNEEDGLARGTISGSSFWSLDLTIGKVFSLGKGMDLELRGAFFNVLNDQTPLTRQDKAVGSFDTPLTRQFPRSGTVFVRLSF